MGNTMLQLSIYSDRVAGKLRRRIVDANLFSFAPDALRRSFLSHRLIFIRPWQMSADFPLAGRRLFRPF